MADKVINKVKITAEAQFDYESSYDYCMPKTDIKKECEKYINNMQESGRLLNDYYFRCKYIDEQTEHMLMLFFYKGKRFGRMQVWELHGVCKAEDWCQELEDCGQVRAWLSSPINPEDTGDWVWDMRVREEKRQREIEEWLND